MPFRTAHKVSEMAKKSARTSTTDEKSEGSDAVSRILEGYRLARKSAENVSTPGIARVEEGLVQRSESNGCYVSREPIVRTTTRSYSQPTLLGAASAQRRIRGTALPEPQHGFGLVDVLSNLRQSIEAAQREDGFFKLNSVEVELAIEVHESKERSGGLEFYVRAGTTSVKETSAVHRITLQLEVAPSDRPEARLGSRSK